MGYSGQKTKGALAPISQAYEIQLCAAPLFEEGGGRSVRSWCQLVVIRSTWQACHPHFPVLLNYEVSEVEEVISTLLGVPCY